MGRKKGSRFSALILFALLASAGEAVAIQPDEHEASFEVRRGVYLWHVWENPAYSQRYTWGEFFDEVSQINDIPATDEAWRALDPGTTITLPPLISPELVARTASLEDQVAEAKTQLTSLADSVALLTAAVQAEALSEPLSQVTFWRTLFIVAMGVAAMLLVLFIGTKVDAKKEREDYSVAYPFLDRWAQRVTLPTSFYNIHTGGIEVYLRRSAPVDGDPAVFLGRDPVKLKNIHRAIHTTHKSNPTVLAEEGIVHRGMSHGEAGQYKGERILVGVRQ